MLTLPLLTWAHVVVASDLEQAAVDLLRTRVAEFVGVAVGRSTLREVALQFGVDATSIRGKPPVQGLCLKASSDTSDAFVLYVSGPSLGYGIVEGVYVIWDKGLVEGLFCEPISRSSPTLPELPRAMVPDDILAVGRLVLDSLADARADKSRAESGSIGSWKGLEFDPMESLVLSVDLPCGYRRIVQSVGIGVSRSGGVPTALGLTYTEEAY